MPSSSANLRGIVMMVAASGCFAVNDACSKFLLPHMPLSELLALRGVVAGGLLLALIALRGEIGGIRFALQRNVMGRAGIETVSALLYVSALAYITLADASAIQQAAPMFTTAIAVTVFGTRVGWQRWLAVAAGFAGVLLVIKPGAGSFQPVALVMLGCALLVAIRDFVTGSIPVRVPTLVVTLVTAGVSALAGFALAGAQEWRALEGTTMLLLGLSGLALVIGHMSAIAAFRGTAPDVVSPFRYSNVLFAVVLGLALFGQMLDGLSLVGVALVIGAGLYSLHQEWAHRPAGSRDSAVHNLPALAKSKV
ncbi:DMT family transporter [Ancylobacter terrae]|uniref:DMT family transporter n=1 Tax=Ancylobacter sp. sgz301288 TaxID=3342077 RepID=UPI003858C441